MHLQKRKKIQHEKCEKGGWVGDFDLQPLSMSVQNLPSSQIKLRFILHGRSHAARMTVNEHVDGKKD